MASLFIAISGCSGGNQGPHGMYRLLAKQTIVDAKWTALETTADDVMLNVEKIKNLIDSHQNVYLMGYSMGGAVAAIAARQIEDKTPGVVKGVVLLSSQTDGLRALENLNIPVLAYHGDSDPYFATYAIAQCLKNTPRYKLVTLPNAGHDLVSSRKQAASDIQHLATRILSDCSDFFGIEAAKTHLGEVESIPQPRVFWRRLFCSW